MDAAVGEQGIDAAGVHAGGGEGVAAVVALGGVTLAAADVERVLESFGTWATLNAEPSENEAQR